MPFVISGADDSIDDLRRLSAIDFKGSRSSGGQLCFQCRVANYRPPPPASPPASQSSSPKNFEDVWTKMPDAGSPDIVATAVVEGPSDLAAPAELEKKKSLSGCLIPLLFIAFIVIVNLFD